jgi:hypothetical protein
VAAGVYQISQLFYTFFASQLGEGALTNLGYADRLNQLPLSIIGTALGTAILPSISRAIERENEAGAPTSRRAPSICHAADAAGDAGAVGDRLSDHRGLVPGRQLHVETPPSPATSCRSWCSACPLTCW